MDRSQLVWIGLACLALVAAGCLGSEEPIEEAADVASEANASEDWARPLPEDVTGLEPLAHVENVEAGAGLDLHGDHAYVSGQNSGVHVVDVSTPEDPHVLGNITGQYTRDVDLVFQDNRTIAVLATNGDGMLSADVTDPRTPEIVGEALTDALVHNVGQVPGTDVVYSARSTGDQVVDIVDISDPANPEVVDTREQLACHDVSFGPEAETAYCPAHAETQIWDITDPLDPQIVSRIHNPSMQIQHWATVTEDGETLIIGDEFAGSTDAAAGCLAGVDTPGLERTTSDPVGAIWFYDVSDPTTPVPISWVAPPVPADNTPPAPCTAHFGEILPGRDKIVVGWRAAGSVLVDFADVRNPEILDDALPVGDNWETRYHNGYLFSGDTDRGLDVVVPTGE
jgi:hypothetical protein